MSHAVNFEVLKWDRLRKLQEQMRLREIGACLLTNPINIRYATNVSVMPIWTSVNLARYALVPVEGEPIVFEYPKALFRAQKEWKKSRPARTWQYRFAGETAVDAGRAWAKEIAGVLSEWGYAKSRLAVDILDHYGYAALQSESLNVCDADEPLEHAKKIKTKEEIVLLQQSCAVAEQALFQMEQAILPGVTENELMGVFWGTMLASGGEHCSTRLLVSGEKTNPWFQEAGDRKVRPGDLVAIDTDMIGPEGYLCDISRTFLCGEKPNPDQKEAYLIARDFIESTIELCRPGVDYQEVMEKVPRSRPEYQELAYSCMIHGSGLDDEPPFFPYPEQKTALRPKGHFETGMVLSVEYYAGKQGSRDGVKLEEQILLTDSGPVRMSRYPWDERIL